MISRALNALGLGRKPVEVTQRSTADAQLIEHLRADVAAYDAKFKLAASDLAKQAEELTAHKDAIAVLKRMAEQDAETIEALTHDASMWRNSLKRSRDRKKVTKHAARPLVGATAPARDKRAKNRGGGK